MPRGRVRQARLGLGEFAPTDAISITTMKTVTVPESECYRDVDKERHVRRRTTPDRIQKTNLQVRPAYFAICLGRLVAVKDENPAPDNRNNVSRITCTIILKS